MKKPHPNNVIRRTRRPGNAIENSYVFDAVKACTHVCTNVMIRNEFQLAMMAAQFFWHGTSIAEGAFKIIEQIAGVQREAGG